MTHALGILVLVILAVVLVLVALAPWFVADLPPGHGEESSEQNSQPEPPSEDAETQVASSALDGRVDFYCHRCGERIRGGHKYPYGCSYVCGLCVDDIRNQ